MRRLIIAVYNPRRFMDVIRRLRKRKIPFLVPSNLDNIKHNDIIYTDMPRLLKLERETGAITFYDPLGTDRVLEEAILALKGKSRYNKVTIGIDPGRVTVLAVIADSELVDCYQTDSIDSLLDKIKYVLETFPSEYYEVKIGMGIKGIRIMEAIRKEFKDISIILVDEHQSSPKLPRRNPFIERVLSKTNISIGRRKDLYAAISIAFKDGIVVDRIDENKT